MANGKYLPKDNPLRVERDLTIANLRLQGKSMAELAEAFDMSKANIHHILNNDENIKAVIDAGTREMVSLVPSAFDVITETLKDKDDKGLRYKAATDTLKTTGIMPSHTTNTFVQQIYNDNSQVTVESNTLVTDLMDFRHRIQPQLETQETIDISPDSEGNGK